MIFSINFALNVAILSLSMRTYFVFLKFHKRKNINKLAFLEIILSWYRRKGDCKKNIHFSSASCLWIIFN